MTEREQTAAQLCRIAADDFRYGEKAQMQAIESLANFTEFPFVLATLRRMAGDDFTYGERASLKAMEILGRVR